MQAYYDAGLLDPETFDFPAHDSPAGQAIYQHVIKKTGKWRRAWRRHRPYSKQGKIYKCSIDSNTFDPTDSFTVFVSKDLWHENYLVIEKSPFLTEIQDQSLKSLYIKSSADPIPFQERFMEQAPFEENPQTVNNTEQELKEKTNDTTEIRRRYIHSIPRSKAHHPTTIFSIDDDFYEKCSVDREIN